ncbi:tetratricopeptide repeat protein [Streptomyces sp. BI20]|uniref:tetratricopeptide repeat protein n=1 Tax=Streptomyces sp. BI20 TaxID=3403460 RepID=UPI003C76685A
MRESHRGAADGVLVRAVDEEVRRGGVSSGERDALLARGRAALDSLAATAAVEYDAYVAALDGAAARVPDGDGRRRSASAALLATGVSAVAAFGADLALDVPAGTAVTVGVITAVAGAAATVAKVTVGQLPAAHRRAGELGRPGGPETLRLQWLSALEVRGIRPFLERQRPRAGAGTKVGGESDTGAAPSGAAGRPAPTAAIAAEAGPPRPRPAGNGAPTALPLRGADRSAEARRRTALDQSFRHLPPPGERFGGRRAELTRIAQWVAAARAGTETRPVVVVLHGEPGVGRTSLALAAAHALRDQYRGACVVDLRGGSPDSGVGAAPLTARDGLLHVLNRLGAPRDQLLFRDRSGAQAQTRRLADLYDRHLRDTAVTLILDDAVDAAQVRPLVPERSDSLVLVTARHPLALPDDLVAWVHHLPVARLAEADAAALLAGDGPRPDAELAAVAERAGGLPLALRVLAGASESVRAAGGALPEVPQAEPLGWALALAYRTLPEEHRRLLRRLSLAGRASLGAEAAAALVDTDRATAGRLLGALAGAGLLDLVRGERYRMHDAVRAFAAARLAAEEDRAGASAAHGRLIRTYAQLADAVIRLVDGKMSTRTSSFDGHGFGSLDAALRWLEDESSFITAALRRPEAMADVDQRAVLDLLGALCDFCLLRGDLYRLGELNELTQVYTAAVGNAVGGGIGVDVGPGPGVGGGGAAVLVAGVPESGAGPGPDPVGTPAEPGPDPAAVPPPRRLMRSSVAWRTGIAARQLGDLDTARTTLAGVVDQYRESRYEPGAARALVSLGITLHHQGHLAEAAARIEEAIGLQRAPELAGDRAWALHALAAVQRDRARLAEAVELLGTSLALHRENESVHGEAWAHFQLGQVWLRVNDVPRAEEELRAALELYGRTRDARGEAWALTQLGRARVVDGDPRTAVPALREALERHRDAEDARGEAWTRYHLGQALEDAGEPEEAVRELERARTMFSRMRDLYGLAGARHQSGRLSRDLRAAQTGNLRNSGFARQLLTDSRTDFRRVGLPHGEAWTCLELAVIDAGNGRIPQALGLCEEAIGLFGSYGDRRGEDWARFLRCTLLPYAVPGDAAEARADLTRLAATPHPARDERLAECVEAYGLILTRGVDPTEEWPAWRLGMTPGRYARETIGVPSPVTPPDPGPAGDED